VLLLEQRLGSGGFGQLAEKVLALHIRQSGRVHLSGKPLAAVDPHLDREGQPSLYSHMAQAESGMPHVVIKLQALAVLHRRHQPAALRVPAHRHGRAWFNGAEHRDEALVHVITRHNLARQTQLVGVGRIQVLIRTPSRFGGSHRRVAHAPSEGLRPVAEILHQNSRGAQICPRASWREQ